VPLASGYAAIQDQIKKSSIQNSTNFVSLANIYWKDDEEKKIIRHLHDNPATIGMHEFVECRDGKKRDFVCRQYVVTVVDGQLEPVPEPCPVCTIEIYDKERGAKLLKPHMVAIGIAAVRTLTEDGSDRLIGDELRKIDIMDEDKSRKTIEVPTVGVIKQSLTNFWNHFVNYFLRYHTTMDRDYEITRLGGKGSKKITYSPIPEDVIPELKTPEQVLSHYKEALQGSTPLDLLAGWINYRASEKYMARLLPVEALAKVGWKPEEAATITRTESTTDAAPERHEDHPGGMDEFAPHATPTPTNGDFNTLRDKILNNYKSDN
jgi:hypothetical protein